MSEEENQSSVEEYASTDNSLSEAEDQPDASEQLPKAPEVGEIPFRLIKRHDKKSIQLASNSGSKSKEISGRHVWHNYEFKDDLFLELVSLSIKDYSDYSDFEIYYVDYKGRRVEKTLRPSSNYVSLKVNTIVSEFGFRPPRRLFSNPKLNDISLYGFELSEAYKYGEFADNLGRAQNKIGRELDAREQALNDRETSIRELEVTRDEVRSEVQELQNTKTQEENKLERLLERRNETSARIESQEQSVRQNQQKLQDVKNDIARVSEVRSKLARSIIDKEAELKILKGNINLFPSELADFVSQGSRDVKLYALLAAIPIAVIATMFAILIEGGVDLTTRITGETDVNILAILVSRMPFVIVAVTIITACYYLARMFILEMVRVNRQKLSLSKIGIVAKDISYSIEQELEMSEDEKQERRLRLKMDMLRDHLKDYLSKDFEPSLPKRSPFEQLRIPGLDRNTKEDSTDDGLSDDSYDDGSENDEDASVGTQS